MRTLLVVPCVLIASLALGACEPKPITLSAAPYDVRDSGGGSGTRLTDIKVVFSQASDKRTAYGLDFKHHNFAHSAPTSVRVLTLGPNSQPTSVPAIDVKKQLLAGCTYAADGGDPRPVHETGVLDIPFASFRQQAKSIEVSGTVGQSGSYGQCR